MKGIEMKEFYILFKYNEDQLCEIDQFTQLEAAIEHAKTIHNPDWPAWEGINVWCSGQTLFDSQSINGFAHISRKAGLI